MEASNIDHLLEEIKALKNRIKELEKLSPDQKIGQTNLSADLAYRTIFRMSPNTFVVSRLKDGVIFDVSDSFCQKSGFSREEAIGKTAMQLGLWPNQDRDQMVQLLLSNGGYKNREVTHSIKGGKKIVCLQSAELIQIADERYVMMVVTDITVMKEAEQTLIEERDLSNKLIDSLPGWFYLINRNKKFIRWNKNMEILTGYSAEEIGRMDFLVFHREADHHKILEEAERLWQSGEAEGEKDLVMKDGTVRTFLFSARKIKYRGEDCIIGHALDITDKKLLEQELKDHAENLEDANIALRVVMTQRNIDQKDFEEKLQTNINELVMPYVKKIKKAEPDERIMKYMSILEKNLQDVLSPFMRDFQSAYKNLTPQEIHIVDMIRNGKSSKDIAKILNASEHTIMTHRNNIRKKLKLVKSKTNLRSHILSLK
jgi:PAS domain S-box-containing protein